MFAKTLTVAWQDESGELRPVPIAWLDSFAMRNFTNNAAFDDTLPAGDGLLEVGFRVSTGALEAAMAGWFRRKGWLPQDARLQIREQVREHR